MRSIQYWCWLFVLPLAAACGDDGESSGRPGGSSSGGVSAPGNGGSLGGSAGAGAGANAGAASPAGGGGGSGNSVGAGNGGAASGGAPPVFTGCPAECRTITIPEADLRFDLGGFWGAAIYGGIYDFPYPSDTPQASFLALSFTHNAAMPGTYDFAPPDPSVVIGTSNGNGSSCDVCPVILSDVWGDNATYGWFPVSGRVVLKSAIHPAPDQHFLSNPDTGQYTGQLEGLVFERLHYLDLPWAWRGFDDSADCICLADTRFDTRLVDGRPCTSAEDCGHPRQACDPRSGTCTTRQCSTDSDAPLACSGDDVCLMQAASMDVGGCYVPCTPSEAASCPDGAACVGADHTGTSGVCKPPSSQPTEPWDECSPDDITTGCSSGQICADPSAIYIRRCYPTCDYFASDPGCPEDARCIPPYYDPVALRESWACGLGGCYEGSGICRRDSQNEWWVADDVMNIGDPCAAEQAGYACGFAAGARKLGECRDLGDGVRCRAYCRVGEACPGGGDCQQLRVDNGPDTEARLVPGLGLCP